MWPREASRCQAVMLPSAALAAVVLRTTVNPTLVTEFSEVFSAVALPLSTYHLLIVLTASLAALLLMLGADGNHLT